MGITKFKQEMLFHSKRFGLLKHLNLQKGLFSLNKEFWYTETREIGFKKEGNRLRLLLNGFTLGTVTRNEFRHSCISHADAAFKHNVMRALFARNKLSNLVSGLKNAKRVLDSIDLLPLYLTFLNEKTIQERAKHTYAYDVKKAQRVYDNAIATASGMAERFAGEKDVVSLNWLKKELKEVCARAKKKEFEE